MQWPLEGLSKGAGPESNTCRLALSAWGLVWWQLLGDLNTLVLVNLTRAA
jgi:hypothetical protein